MDLIEVVKVSQVIVLIVGGMLSSAVTAIVTFKIMQYKVDRIAKDQADHKLELEDKLKRHESDMKSQFANYKQEVSENNKAIWNKMEKFEDKFDRLFQSIGKIEGILTAKDKD